MKERQSGYMTVEATISLTIFLFMMMFMMNFGQIFRVQNYIHHNLLQAGKMVGFFSYDYANRTISEDVFSFIESLTDGGDSVEGKFVLQQLLDRKEKDYGSVVTAAFETIDKNCKDIINAYGVDEVKIKAIRGESDLDITAEYVIKLRFQFFGIKSITMHQNVKCGLWS